jgi:hypothetical protein
MRIKVITAITKNKDNLREDFEKCNNEFIAFLDKETAEETFTDLWEIRPAYDKFKEPRRNAKIHKILPHLFVDTDVSIWLDANISLKITPEQLVDKWLDDKGISTWDHFARDCWYEEATCVSGPNYDHEGLVKEQMERYEREGLPHFSGLSECNVIVRRHTDKINRLCEQWWAEICRHSSRDQISFPYVFRDNVRRIKGNPREHIDFNYAPHNFLEINYTKECAES